jgi:hypothetical protein
VLTRACGSAILEPQARRSLDIQRSFEEKRMAELFAAERKAGGEDDEDDDDEEEEETAASGANGDAAAA